MPTLYACFLENDTELMERHWLNKVAAQVAPSGTLKPKIHVELFFPDNVEQGDIVSGRACSIHYNGTVFLAKKRFSRKQWSFRSLDVSSEQYDKVLSFCELHKGEHFNHLSYFLQPVNHYLGITPHWPTRFGYSSRWFCSEICLGALKSASIVPVSTFVSMHPQEMFNLLEDATTSACVRNMDNIPLSF
jgi:hypothetical protein